MSAHHRLRVDQSAEYAELVAILKRHGPGGAVVLGGSGMGKTSLVHAALDRTDVPSPALRLHCTPTLAAVPYGALSPYLSTLERIEDPVQVLREVNGLLETTRNDGTIPVAIVEDAQFLDPESSFVLSMLVENAALKLIAIGAGRIDGDSTLFSLTESGVLSTLVVQPFDDEGVRFLAEELTGGVLADGAVAATRAMTGGNPSFVKAYVQSCLDQGILVRDPAIGASGAGSAGKWLLARLVPEPDEGLVELVREMQSALTTGQQHILELLALGGPQPRALLAAGGATGYRHLVESGILVEERDGRIRIRAEIHAVVLRQVVAPGRSAELYREWEKLHGGHVVEPTPLQVLWGLEVGANVTMEESVSAVATSTNQLDHALAWKLCAVAGISANSDEGALLEARTLLGLGRHYSARAMLTGLAERTTDPSILQRALAMLFMVIVQLGFDDGDLEVVDNLWSSNAERVRGQSSFEAAAAEHHRTTELFNMWHAVQESDAGPQVTADVEQLLAKRDLTAGARSIALLLLSDIHSVNGRTETALRLARQAMTELDQDARLSGSFQLAVLFRIGWNLVFSGRYAEAEEFLSAHRGATVRLMMHRHGSLSLIRAIGQLLQGQIGAARHSLSEAIAECRLRDPAQLLALALSLEAIANRRAMAGSIGQKHSQLKDREDVQPLGRGADGTVTPRLLTKAVSSKQGPASATLAEYPILEREILAGSIERLHGDEVVTADLGRRLFDLASGMEGQRAHFLARLSDPAAQTDAVAAQSLANEACAAGEYQVAAESMARAAMLLSSAGDSRRCGAVLRELMELVRERQLVPDAYVARALAMAELTSREEEIVELARQGKNNAEIARALTVSQRTVEGHLYRVFSKLGITDRSELGRLRLFAGTNRSQNG